MAARRSRWIARALCAAVGCSPLAAQHAQGPDASSSRLTLDTRALLAACTTRNVTLTAHKLADLGAAATAKLTRDWALDLEPWTQVQRDAIEAALRERIVDTRAALIAVTGEESSFAVHARALQLLARIGTSRDLPTAALLARTSDRAEELDADDEEPASPASVLRECAASLVERNAAAANELPRALRDCADELKCALIDALVDVGRPSELDTLAELLRMRAWTETYLIGAIARTARKLPAPFEERVLAAVRSELRAADAAIAREAATCAGWLEDDVAADELAALLDHTDPGVRANAGWALRRMTGRGFACDAVAWRRWIDTQHEWWQERAGRVFDDIARGAPVARMAAMNEVLRQSWPRHALAFELARALPHNDPLAVGIGCDALTRLRSRAAIAPLRELLQEVDGRAFETVEAALCALESAPAIAPVKPADE